MSHWSWWALPHDQARMSEPPEADSSSKTWVTKYTAEKLLNQAPDCWRQVLEALVLLILFQGLDATLPRRDLARVERFTKYWFELQQQGVVLPLWLAEVLMKLRLIMQASSLSAACLEEDF